MRYDGTTGAFLGTFASGGGLIAPYGIQFGPDHNLYVAGGVSGNVVRYNGITGQFIDQFVPQGSGGLVFADGIVFGPDGNLYVADNRGSGAERPSDVLRYNGTTGMFIDTFVSTDSGGLNAGRGLVFGLDGNLYVSSFRSSQVLRYSGTNGAFIDAFVPTGSGGLSGPRFLMFAPVGPCARPDITGCRGH